MNEQIAVASRVAFGQSILDLGATNNRIVVLDADLSKSTNTYNFGQKYPQRFFQMGIAEANMIGVASGLALSGYVPFACSFACFISGRFDQIKMSVAYSKAGVRIVGTHAGVGIGEDGYSQQGLEDLALMRSLPTMQVLQPGDDIETKAMVSYLAQSSDPAYLRLTRQNLVRVHEAEYKFILGKFPMLKTGNDMAIFASGGTLYNSIVAANSLKAQGLDIRVYNASSIKPCDDEAVYKAARETKVLFSIEDHSIIGGLGGAIAESLAGRGHVPALVRIGVADDFGESGTPEDLYDKHGLSSDKIAQRIMQASSSLKTSF